MTDAQWKAKLSPAAYRTLRHEATETPFTSPLNTEHRAGIFSCAGCALPLYSSKTKFESGTGWPSFWAPPQNAGTHARGSHARFRPDRGALPAVRWASGPCVR